MKKSNLARLLTLTLAALMLLTACGKPPEDTTPEDEYAGLYQPTYLKWPTDMPNVPAAVLSGSIAYAFVVRDEGYSIERITLPDNVTTTLATIQAEETEGNLFIYRSVATLCPVPDGLWYGSYTATQDSSDPNLVETTAVYELVHVDDNGKELARIDVTETIGDGDFVSIAADNDGNVAMVSSDKRYHAFDQAGMHLFTGDYKDFARLVRSADGSVYLREKLVNSSLAHTLALVDFSSKKLGDTVDITNFDATWINCGIGDDDFYMITNKGIYGLTLDEGIARPILNFIRHDIGSKDMILISADEKGDFYGLETSRATSEYAYLPLYLQSMENLDLEDMETTPSILQGKIELTYATLVYLSLEHKDLIDQFNRSNSQYKINVIDYYEKADKNVKEAVELLLLDITAGNIPDIFDLSKLELPRDKWDTLAIDLYPFLDSDPVCNRDEFVPNILTALEYEESLYQISYGFVINTMVGKERIFGSELGWSFEDAQKMQETLPSGTMLIGNQTNQQLFSSFFKMNLDRFVNESEGKCYFDSEEFINMLEWCNTLPQNAKYNPEPDVDLNDLAPLIAASSERWDRFQELLAQMDEEHRQDTILLTPARIPSPRAIRQYKEIFGEDINFIGYPGTEYGTTFEFYELFSISTTCQYPDIAWEFISALISSDLLDRYNMPVLSDKLDNLLKYEMTPLSQRESNRYVPASSRVLGIWSPTSQGGPLEVRKDTPEYENYHLTQEEVDQFMEMVNAATSCMYYDGGIFEIINDAVAPFFAGGKSAEETAKEIQSRVSILLAERN